jgi:hypothetical protein
MWFVAVLLLIIRPLRGFREFAQYESLGEDAGTDGVVRHPRHWVDLLSHVCDQSRHRISAYNSSPITMAVVIVDRRSWGFSDTVDGMVRKAEI